MLYLLYRACGPSDRFSWKGIAILLELRMIASTWIVDVAVLFYGQETWYPLLRELANLIHAFLALSLLRYFQGSPGKKLFAVIWTETIAMGCLMGAWALAYWGTGQVYVMSGQSLQPRDALMVLFYFPLSALCIAAMNPVLKFYRGYRFRHPQLILGLGALSFFSRIVNNIYSSLPQGTYQLTGALLLCNLMAVLLVILFMKQAKLRKRIYTEQLHSVEAHLNMLQEQAAWVADSRARLERQIAMAESLSRSKQGEVVGIYLAELKGQYHTFLAGVRCRNQMVDTLLCYKDTFCRQQGISTEFSLQQYDRGCLEEQEVDALLLMLFDGAMQSCLKNAAEGHISLNMALVKGQFLAEISYSGRQKLTKEGIRPILSRHAGTLLQKRTRTGRTAKILLQASPMPE